MQVASPVITLIVVVILTIIVLIFIPSSPQKRSASARLKDIVEIGEVTYFETAEYLNMSGSSFPNDGDYYARPLFTAKGGSKSLLNYDDPEERASFMGAVEINSNEAIAIWGDLTPDKNSKYFGITGYVYDLEDRESAAVSPTNTSSSNRKVVMASLADSISTSEVNGPVCVIMTPSRNLVEPLRAKLLSTPGFPSNSTFKTIGIPSNVYRSDYRYTLLIHLAYQNNSSDNLSSTGSTQLVPTITHINENTNMSNISMTPNLNKSGKLPTFKTVRYQNIGTTSDPFNQVLLKSRGVNRFESGLVLTSNNQTCDETILNAATNALTANGYVVVQRLDVKPFLSTDLGPRGLDNGFQCISRVLNCNGDNRDRTIFQTSPFKIANGEKIAVYAINHAASHKAIYSNVTFSKMYTSNSPLSGQSLPRSRKTSLELSTPSISITLPDDALNSPVRFKSDTVQNNFVGYLSEITGDSQSIQAFPSLRTKLIIHNTIVDPNTTLIISEKIYLEPSSKIGPAVDEVIPMLVFLVK
jgi:hypothetical protein